MFRGEGLWGSLEELLVGAAVGCSLRQLGRLVREEENAEELQVGVGPCYAGFAGISLPLLVCEFGAYSGGLHAWRAGLLVCWPLLAYRYPLLACWCDVLVVGWCAWHVAS